MLIEDQEWKVIRGEGKGEVVAGTEIPSSASQGLFANWRKSLQKWSVLRVSEPRGKETPLSQQNARQQRLPGAHTGAPASEENLGVAGVCIKGTTMSD